MKIDVTAEDIELGKPSSACECPVARAIKREVKRNIVKVLPGAVWIDNDNYTRRYRVTLPSVVTAFIYAFDSLGGHNLDSRDRISRGLKPFTFELDYTEP